MDKQHESARADSPDARHGDAPSARAFYFGTELGREHPRVWDAPPRWVEEHGSEVRRFVAAEAARTAGASIRTRLLTWALGFGGLAFLVWATESGTAEAPAGTALLSVGVVLLTAWLLLGGVRAIGWMTRPARIERVADSLSTHAWRGFASAIDERRERLRAHTPGGAAKGATPPPDPQPFGVSDAGAEALVCAWMRHLGESDAEVTRFTGDGGIDVGSEHYVAQVKNYTGTVGVAAIRELFGVASAEGRRPAFFTSGTYSADALSFASRIEMPLFIYDAINGTLAGATPAAERLLTTGL